MNGGLDRVRCGFLPLMDAAVLIAAREGDFDTAEGLHLELVRETSWANIRDRIAIGHFDVAHMLAPMPIAAALGLTSIDMRVIAPMTLGVGGNAVTVSAAVWSALDRSGIDGDAASAGAALRALVETRRTAGLRNLTLSVVHPFSCQSYELRYWLAACGIDPDRDVTISVLPPPFLPDALAAGHIDGFCAGEPWSSVAVARGAGRILTTKSAIWRSGPEKVLGVSERWAARHPMLLLRLMRALHRAALWCDAPSNAGALAELLSAPQYLGLSRELIIPGLTGTLAIGEGRARQVAGFHRFAANSSMFPWVSQALWLYSQMARWGQAPLSEGGVAACRSVFRPDLYRCALEPMGIAAPAADERIEGASPEETLVEATRGRITLDPNRFFDGAPFDPRRTIEYARSLPFSRAGIGVRS